MGRRLSGSVKGCQHERPLPRREIEINVRGSYFFLVNSSILVAASTCNGVESSGLCFSSPQLDFSASHTALQAHESSDAVNLDNPFRRSVPL
jgi:hypothetical protein